MNILKEVFSGNIGTALGKIWRLVTGNPAIKAFVSQFDNDFGARVLADAEVLAPDVLSGKLSILDAAAKLIKQAVVEARSVAASDATTIALNALRAQMTKLSPPAA